MSANVAALDRDRLARIFGMLGSDHAGEVAAAGGAAVASVPLGRAPQVSWEIIVDAALANHERLNPWEQGFIALLDRRRARDLSPRQGDKLAQIAEKLGHRRDRWT